MADTLSPAAPAAKPPLNGVNTPTLLATLGAVKSQPSLATFQFRATNRWIGGTHSETRIESFSGAGGEHTHKSTFADGADHPAVLTGRVARIQARADSARFSCIR
jgi:hypothetical protein